MNTRHPSNPRVLHSSNSRILGIDPGLQRTGWGLIEKHGSEVRFIASGVIKSEPNDSLADRLHQLNRQLVDIIARHQPHAAAIEETFVNKSGASTLKLGQARGALLLTLAQAELPTAEYAANLVKKTITGSGHADKTQVARMVAMLLPAARAEGADAWDALAVALCHGAHVP